MDVFGFSRGAAAARHFVGRRSPEFFPVLSSLSGALGVEADAIVINFVGFYDSVSSYGGEKHKTLLGQILNNKLHKSFDDNVAELRLAIGGGAAQVVQFAAADEYRENFASTNIRSSVRAGRSLAVRMPGVHSDIGGSYAPTLTEDRLYGWDFPLGVVNFFKERGWYGPGQLTESTRYVGENATATVVNGRRQVPNRYQFVNLSIMLKLAAAASSGLQFGSPNQDEQRGIKYVIDAASPLFGIKSQLESFALGHFGASGSTLTPALPPAEYKWLRQHYLHLSWSDRLGFEFRRDAQGQPTRLILAG